MFSARPFLGKATFEHSNRYIRWATTTDGFSAVSSKIIAESFPDLWNQRKFKRVIPR
jgi:hypothetical protein